MKLTYHHTIRAGFTANIVLAIVNNFAPLLFLTFQSSYHIPLSQITLLITINFGIQLVVDAFSIGFIDRLGYRVIIVTAHLCTTAGLVLLALLPGLLPNAYTGLLIAVLIYGVGAGLMDVITSPIVEACPTDNKEKTMSQLHAFYSWGHVAVVLLSTLFFALIGIDKWPILALVWAIVPFVNMILFTRVPIATLKSEHAGISRVRQLVQAPVFWVFLLMMFFSGASEMSVVQWASTYAEQALGVSKTVGDLAGPMLFAIAMGLSRTLYARPGHKVNLQNFMLFSSALAIVSYLMISLSPWPVLGLIGCGVCGFAIAIMWPGTLSTGAAALPEGGATMFAMFALAGHLGASGGPTFVGMVASAAGDNLRMGVLASTLFPAGMTVLLILYVLHLRRSQSQRSL